jgi:YggT family protein
VILVANLLSAAAGVLSLLLNFLWILILVRVIASWLSADPYNPLMRFVIEATEPLLRPMRKIMPSISRQIDLSPIFLIAAIFFVDAFLVSSLRDYAMVMRRSAIISSEVH